MEHKPDPDGLRRIEAALLELEAIDREIFLAVRLDRLDYRRIARVTGLSVRQVERRMARAIRHLARALEDRGGR